MKKKHSKKKCDHDWYFSDSKFEGDDWVGAEQTCEKCGKKRLVAIEKYK
jgi:hypothetical protein